MKNEACFDFSKAPPILYKDNASQWLGKTNLFEFCSAEALCVPESRGIGRFFADTLKFINFAGK